MHEEYRSKSRPRQRTDFRERTRAKEEQERIAKARLAKENSLFLRSLVCAFLATAVFCAVNLETEFAHRLRTQLSAAIGTHSQAAYAEPFKALYARAQDTLAELKAGTEDDKPAEAAEATDMTEATSETAETEATTPAENEIAEENTDEKKVEREIIIEIEPSGV
ncbi:MAG: hypothetical protein IJC39_00035 [Firmicutes bacterium]|nr:hypothetical protein [Bacillota bacterium]